MAHIELEFILHRSFVNGEYDIKHGKHTASVKIEKIQNVDSMKNVHANDIEFMGNIEGIFSVLSECWDTIENEKDIPINAKLKSLRLAKEYHESTFKLFLEGPAVAKVKQLDEEVLRFKERYQMLLDEYNNPIMAS